MNPSSGEKNLPQFEVPQTNEGLEQQHDKQMERNTPSESAAGKQQPRVLNTAVLQLPADIPVAGPVALPADLTQPDDNKLKDKTIGADHDSHRMEKEWVERAKKVIAQTKDDPHAQKHDMSKVKAEYIRKRFNKTIPTDDTAPA